MASPARRSRRGGASLRKSWNPARLRDVSACIEPLEPRLLLSVAEAGAMGWAAGLAEPGPTDIAVDYDRLPPLPADYVVGAAGPTRADALPPETWSGVLDVLVEPGLLSSIQSSIDQYVADLMAEGYTVSVQEFTGSADQLRAHLQARWSSAGIEGAVFVGDLPVMMFTHANDFYGQTSTFIHDLYFMDLDGTYILSDTDPDQHIDGSGDIAPEIYVSRITPSGVVGLTGQSEVGLIQDYFAKVHDYRVGALTYNNRGIVWSDDDWQSSGYVMQGLYDEVLNVRDPGLSTRQSYVDCLGMDYEFMEDMIHSSQTSHSIQGVGSGWVSSANIRDLNPRQGFYNLWNCSSANFTYTNNLIAAYVYSGDYGLNAVGSTKTGAMLSERYYYDYMSDAYGDQSAGRAFYHWWQCVDNHSDSRKSWHYGMTMQGDPTLRPGAMGEQIVFADAGSDFEADHGQVVTLDGSGSHSSSGHPLSYQWEQIYGTTVQINNADQATPTFLAVETGTYGFRLTALDGEALDRDEVYVNVSNPVVFPEAGPSQEVLVDQLVTLDGSASYALSGHDLTYTWQQMSGTAVTIQGADQEVATFTPTVAGSYRFRLTAWDGEVRRWDEVYVTVLAVARPSRVDLLAECDTGLSDEDNWTWFNNESPAKALKFMVYDTIPGATISLYRWSTFITSVVADSTTTLITLDGATALAEGSYRVSARQQEPGKVQSTNSDGVFVIVDTVAPTVQSVSVLTPGQLMLTFSEQIPIEWCQDPASYHLDHGPAIVSAVRDYDSRVVFLDLAEPLTGSDSYLLSVDNIEDQAGNAVAPGTQGPFEYHEIDPDLLAWWTFDDGQTGATVADASGHGRDLTLVGALRSEDGRIGSAAWFDGLDDYAVDDDAENYINGLGAVTVAMWIRSSETGCERGFFTTADPPNKDCLNARYNADGADGGGEDIIKAYVQTSSTKHKIEGASGTQTTDWQHVALTWASGQPIRLFVDGVEQVLTWDEGALGGSLSGATKFLLGNGYKTPDGSWWGLIDDVRIYGRALDAQEVAALADLAPVAVDDAYEMQMNSTIWLFEEDGLLVNDYDPDGGPQAFTAERVAGPYHGGVSIGPDGSIEYWPQQGFVGTDTVTYRLFDGALYSNIATVTITVVADQTPFVRTINTPTRSEVFLDFNEDLDKASAQNLANYQFDHGLTVVSAVRQPDWSGVVLTLSEPMVDGETYTLSIGGVCDLVGNRSDSQVSFEYVDWRGSDVGSPWPVGSESRQAGVWTVRGAGEGIAAGSDNFHYVYTRELADSDGEIIVRLVSLDSDNPTAEAGVMIRSSLEGGSVFGMTSLSAAGNIRFAWRSNTYGTLSQVAGPAADTPRWLRIVHFDNYVVSYVSADGHAWQQVSFQYLPMPEAVFFGLAVTNGADDELATAVFDNVMVVQYAGALPTADILDVQPDPRTDAVDEIVIDFDRPVYGFNLADLTLRRDGGVVPLTGASLITTDDMHYVLSGLAALTGQAGSYVLRLTASGSGVADVYGHTLTSDTTESWTVKLPAQVAARRIFYNNSWFDDQAQGRGDDDAVATDKLALEPGDPAGFANYTSYSKGINGVMVDIAGLWDFEGLSAADFTFLVGNSSDLADWSPAPAPQVTVRPGAGAGGSYRVTLTWPDNAIQKQWLRVEVEANDRTGLTEPDVFYFGNAIGDSGDSGSNANVDSGDRLGARANPRGTFNPAPIDFAYDYNRDHLVDSGDRLIARANATSAFTALKLITAPPASSPAAPEATGESAGAVGAGSDSSGLAPGLEKGDWHLRGEQHAAPEPVPVFETGTSAANDTPLRSQSPFPSPAFLIAPLLDAIQVAAPTWVPSRPRPLAQSSAQTRRDAAAVADEPWPSADDQPPATIDILAAPRLAVL